MHIPYLRYSLQPERINGHNHYIAGGNRAGAGGIDLNGSVNASVTQLTMLLRKLKDSRRHLFFSDTYKTWVIALRCDDYEGILARAVVSGYYGAEDIVQNKQQSTAAWAVCFAPRGLGDATTASLNDDGNVAAQREREGEQERELKVTLLSAERAEEEFGMTDDDKARAAKVMRCWEASNERRFHRLLSLPCRFSLQTLTL